MYQNSFFPLRTIVGKAIPVGKEPDIRKALESEESKFSSWRSPRNIKLNPATNGGRMLKWITLAVITLAISAATVVAGEIEDLAREAEAKMNAGQHVEAVELLRRAINLLTAKAPLTLRRVQFIAAAPKGFGIYQPRGNNVFRAGEPLIVYAEPVGLAWKIAEGVNRAHIVTDFEIRTLDGKVLGGQKDFGRFEFASREQNQEIMTHLTITLSGAPSGQYVFAATYRDQVSSKSATLELPFEIK